MGDNCFTKQKYLSHRLKNKQINRIIKYCVGDK